MLRSDSIHKAMVDAAWTPESDRLKAVVTSKVTRDTKKKAEFICQRNNTNLSAFIRHCVSQLCQEYDPSHKE